MKYKFFLYLCLLIKLVRCQSSDYLVLVIVPAVLFSIIFIAFVGLSIAVCVYYCHSKRVIKEHQAQKPQETKSPEKKLSTIKEDTEPIAERKIKSAGVQTVIQVKSQSTQLDSEEDDESNEKKYAKKVNSKQNKQVPYKELSNEIPSESSSLSNDPRHQPYQSQEVPWYHHKPSSNAPPPVALSTNAIDLTYEPISNKMATKNTRKIFQSPHYSIFAYENR